MEFFLQKNSHFEKFVEQKLGECVAGCDERVLTRGGADVLFRDLFNAFHPTATGSLFHWSKVFLALYVLFLRLCASVGCSRAVTLVGCRKTRPRCAL